MDNVSKPVPFAVLSHNDLDGAVSAAVMMHALDAKRRGGANIVPFVRWSSTGQSANDDVFDLAELGIPTVVSDLAISGEAWSALVSVPRPAGTEDIPFVVDHHPESKQFSKLHGAVVDMSSSAALLCLVHCRDVLGISFFANPRLVRAAELADDYDMWKHKTPESRRLNAFLSTMGPEVVMNESKLDDGLVSPFSEVFDSVVDSWFGRQKSRVEKAASEALFYVSPSDGETTLAIVPAQERFSTGDMNETAEHLKEKGAACAAFILKAKDGSNCRVSLRSVGGVARKVLSELKILGATGGGHPDACGARFAGASIEEETLPAIIAGAFERAVSAGEVPIFEPAN